MSQIEFETRVCLKEPNGEHKITMPLLLIIIMNQAKVQLLSIILELLGYSTISKTKYAQINKIFQWHLKIPLNFSQPSETSNMCLLDPKIKSKWPLHFSRQFFKKPQRNRKLILKFQGS